MGRVVVHRTNRIRDFNTALYLKLSNPAPFSEQELLKLAELIRANLDNHVESGTLISAFQDVHVYQSGQGKSSVGIGDRSILTKPTTSPRGTIREFVNWLRGERGKRWQAFKERYAGVKKEREVLKESIRTERGRARLAKRPTAKRIPVSKLRRERAEARRGIIGSIRGHTRRIEELKKQLAHPPKFATAAHYKEWESQTFSELLHARSMRSQATWMLKRQK